MTNEVQLKTFATINHIVSAAGISDGGFSPASEIDTSVDNTTNLAPLCNVIFKVTFSAAPGASKGLDVYRRDLNIYSTNDEPDPDVNYPSHYMGTVIVNVTTAVQYLQLQGAPLPPTACDFFVYNNASAAIASGWCMDVQPYTYAPAV